MLCLERTLTVFKSTGKIILTYLGLGTIGLIGPIMIITSIILAPFEYIITGDIKLGMITSDFIDYSLECLYKKLWGGCKKN